MALQLYRVAGLGDEESLRACGPLVTATVQNVLRDGPARALTGPISRGDLPAIRKHLDVLAAMPEDLGRLYRQLGLRTIELAREGEKIDEPVAQTLRELLETREHE